MTGRTHDLAAFTGLTIAFVATPLAPMSLATLVAAIGANFVGGLAPDLDSASASLWRSIRGGTLISPILAPILGGHRFISHSLVGLLGTAWLLKHLLAALNTVLLVDMNVIWWAFMIGMVSHIFTDMLTRDGVPFLFPIPWEIGIPPFRFLRMRTGGLIEKSLVFPGLILTNAYLIYLNYGKLLDFLRHYLS